MLYITVQLETKGNGQNEIVRHRDRLEVRLQNSEKHIVISHIQNEILKQKNFTGSGFEGTPKLFSKLSSQDYFYIKTMKHSRLQLGHFFFH